MPRTRAPRPGPARFGPLLLALSMCAAFGGTSAVLVSDDEVPSYAAPAERAAMLGLPAPSARADAEHPACAADVQGQQPTACFPARRDADDYIAGRSRNSRTVTLAGFGGTSASATGSPAVGLTCTSSGCGGGSTTWYSTTGANCTHAYPYNDYYRNNVSTYYYAQNLATGVGNLNCNRMVLYRDGLQSGAGALDCGSTTSVCGSGAVAYQSISWHNG